MANNPEHNPENPLAAWLLTLIMLVCVWPVGLLLLIRMLNGGTLRRPVIARRGPIDVTAREIKDAPPVRPASQPPHRPAAAKTAPPRKQPTAIRASGTPLMVLGALLLAISGLALLNLVPAMLSTGWQAHLRELTYGAGGLATSLVLLRFGVSRRKRAGRFRKYRTLIGSRESLPIAPLAKAMPVSYKKACSELQEMLDDGILPTGYVDYATGRLVLSDDGIVEPPAQTPPPADEDAVLRQIREAGSRIQAATMGCKIRRIQALTARILDYQKENPDRSGELRSFLNYYLPTTQKLLRSYAQLEAQGVEGDNISASKARIEDMMDKLIAGFEAQLDKLFQSEALDISSDMAVLEQMLRKDGLSQEEDFIHLER